MWNFSLFSRFAIMMLHWKYSSIDNFENRKFLKSSLSECKTSGFVIVTQEPVLVCNWAKLKSSIFRPLRIMSLIQTTTNWELTGLTTIEFILNKEFDYCYYYTRSFWIRACKLLTSVSISGWNIELLLINERKLTVSASVEFWLSMYKELKSRKQFVKLGPTLALTVEFILKELFYLLDYFLPSFSVSAFWESVNSQSDSLSVSIFSSGLNIKLLLFLSIKNLTASRPLRKSSNLWRVQLTRLSQVSMWGSKNS